MTDKPMSEAELKEIEELLRKAVVVVGKTPRGSDIIDTSDMDIQTLACRDVPRLIAEVRRQRGKRIEDRARVRTLLNAGNPLDRIDTHAFVINDDARDEATAEINKEDSQVDNE